MSSLNRWISDKDLFSTTPTMNYKGTKHSTLCGIVLTILIYAMSLGYLLQGLYYLAVLPIMDSTLIHGSYKEKVDISSMRICMEISLESDLPADYMLSEYLYAVTYTDGEHVPTKEHSFTDETDEKFGTRCVRFTEKTELVLRQTLAMDLIVDFSIQPGTYFKLITYYYELGYNDTDLRTPIEYRWNVIFNEHDDDAVKVYYFDRILYEIEVSPIFSSVKQFDGMRLGRIDKYQKDENPFLASQYPYLFTYSGLTVKNERAFAQLVPLVAETVAIYWFFVFLGKLLFSNYFDFKYSKDLFNYARNRRGESYEMKGKDEEAIAIANDRSEAKGNSSPSGSPTYVAPKSEKMRISYWEYFWSNCCCYKRVSQTFSKSKAKMEGQLDVVNFMQK